METTIVYWCYVRHCAERGLTPWPRGNSGHTYSSKNGNKQV